jgi:Tfp pilus assembly protein PilO
MAKDKPLSISEEAKVQMPMKTVASLIMMVAIGTWAYFGINEKLNQHSTKLELFEKDMELNSEFRIKYPRGELGQSSGEAELFMLVEHIAGILEDVENEIKGMRHNAVNIDFLKEQVKKLNEDVEKLIRNGSGGHQ